MEKNLEEVVKDARHTAQQRFYKGFDVTKESGVIKQTEYLTRAATYELRGIAVIERAEIAFGSLAGLDEAVSEIKKALAQTLCAYAAQTLYSPEDGRRFPLKDFLLGEGITEQWRTIKQRMERFEIPCATLEAYIAAFENPDNVRFKNHAL